ncbi:MAG: hypothetical protein PHR35_12115 [Kiritimatiellae bacterium]|nr:hypothetical protein [Kiritimatiellia bacterium]
MGVALQVQRVTGEQAEYPVIELEEALIIFESIPWEKEIEAWGNVPDEELEEFRPLFHLMDDTGHSLMITAYCRELVGLAYEYPVKVHGALFGTPSFEQGYVGTDQYPRASMRELLTQFFTGDQNGMFSLLQRYPPAANAEEEDQAIDSGHVDDGEV